MSVSAPYSAASAAALSAFFQRELHRHRGWRRLSSTGQWALTGLLERCQRFLICRRDDAHRAAQALVARPDRFIDREKAAQVDIAFQRH